MRSIRILVSALILTAVVSARPVTAQEVLRLGHSEATVVAGGRDFAPLLDHLNASPAFRYELVGFDDTEHLYLALKQDKVDIAILGPLNYVRGHKEFGARVVVADGPRYFSVIAVREDSDITDLTQLAGRRIAFGYPESTSSYLVPLMMMSKAKVNKEALGEIAFVGGHQDVADAIGDGRYDAGGLLRVVFEQNQERSRLRALAMSEPIPGIPLSVRPDLPQVALDHLEERMLSFVPPAEGYVAFSRGAEKVTDADYNQIRFMAKIVLGQDYR